MKKILILIMALFLLLFLLRTAGCSRLRVGVGGSGKVVYEYNGVSFEDDLSQEEVDAVIAVLNGKMIDPGLGGVPSCGFGYDIAVVIDGRRFALACDGCGTVQDFETLGYIHISDAERQVLEQIFTSRGGKFPCV